jgi:hypothetical protein
MPLRSCVHHALAMAAGLALCAPGTAALAHDGSQGDAPGQESWRDHGPDGYPESGYRNGRWEPEYGPGGEAWLADCRQRVSSRDKGVGGAVIGGVVGGLAGNRIAGRGNRTVGTVAGAAVGAAAGVAIDRAEDNDRVRDECEAYLANYYASYAGGQQPHPGPHRGYAQPYGYPAYSAGYAPAYGYAAGGCCTSAPVMMVPAAVQPQPECTETVEYIYEDVPVRHTTYRPAKRTKIVPDKRIRLSPDKRISAK